MHAFFLGDAAGVRGAEVLGGDWRLYDCWGGWGFEGVREGVGRVLGERRMVVLEDGEGAVVWGRGGMRFVF